MVLLGTIQPHLSNMLWTVVHVMDCRTRSSGIGRQQGPPQARPFGKDPEGRDTTDVIK